ncbi:hypothetical protein HK105_203280 [Polyrhizophydium stewartii]|uniref:Glutathione S-transferase n=1 Tax=Polyrhizophydium stewartii TaxID=2732419 RepID=A0ABR4NCE9_9FUNG|nr:hypothetical protein HK105_001101 [Polyrhizophydium stewartii]
MTVHPSLKLTYFELRSRAEPTRLALTIGGIPFVDERITMAQWATLKSKQPFGHVPVLTVNGTTQVAQSNGLLRYAGALTGLYPTADPLKAALVDQIVFQVEDMYNMMYATNNEGGPSNPMARFLAREALGEKTFPPMFAALDAVIAKHSSGTWCVGDSMTVADVALYAFVATLKSGMFVGMPETVADAYPRVIRAFDGVARHPRVVAWEAAHPL